MLCSLPDEILVKILALLDARDRNSRCKLVVNQRLKSIVDSSVILKAFTECELQNLALGTSRHVSLPEVLVSLEERRNAWRTLQSMEELVLPLYDNHERPIPAFGRDCSILYRAAPNKELEFIQIPSKTRHIPFKAWTVDPEMEEGFQVAVDECQDLLVVARPMRHDGLVESMAALGVELRLLSLANGAVHPAAQGSIDLRLTPSSSFHRRISPSLRMTLAGDFVGVMLLWSWAQNDDLLCHLWVCDWKTGEIKVEAWCDDDDSQLSGASSFSFLSTEHILIARHDWPPRRAELLVVDVRGPAQRGSYVTLSGTVFNLPQPGCRMRFGNINIIEGSAPSCSSVGTDSVLSQSPGSQMIWVDLVLLPEMGVPPRSLICRYRLATPAVHLLQCLSKALANRPADHEPSIEVRGDNLHIPWPDWGDEVWWMVVYSSRMNTNDNYTSFCSTSCFIKEIWAPMQLKYRERLPVPKTIESLDVIVIYDFPTAVEMQRETRRPSSPLDPSGPLTLLEVNYYGRETVKSDRFTWDHPVVSAPYRQTVFMTKFD